MYGRGVDDDKGHITARLTALRKYIREVGDLPVNITFMMEGAEESAQTDLGKYLEKYRDDLLPADLLVWEQGNRNSKGQLEITGGNKGIITFDLSVESADVDIHSKFGAVIESASWYLLNAISSMRDDHGRILIDGIYDLKLPILESDRRAFLKTYYFQPALSIEGISTGYQGQGVKTILPAQAKAKMEMRLVPGLTPEYVLDCIKAHLKKEGFDRIKGTFTLGEESYRSDMSAPAIVNVIELAKGFYEEGVAVLPTAAGTGPMHMIYEALGVPMVAFGIGNANSRDHGGNENVSLADYYTHIELIKELIANYE